MNPDNHTKEIKPGKIATEKKRQPGVLPKNRLRPVPTKEFIRASVKRAVICALLAVPLGAFVLGFIMGHEESGVNIAGRVGAGIAYSIFITEDAAIGSRPWMAFHESDVNTLENALPYLHTCIYTATPILYLLLMFLWWRTARRQKFRKD